MPAGTGVTDGQFIVTLSNPSSTNTVVSYTVGGTATAGGDYTTLSGTVTILAGQTTAVIDVAVIEDNIVEGTETVSVTLTSITSGDADISVGAANVATVNITDDDEAVVTLTPVVTAASEQPVGTGVTNGEFILELSNPSSTQTEVGFATFANSDPLLGAIRAGFETANPGAHELGDYRILLDGVEVTGNSFIIPAGTTSLPVTIEVIDDSVVELTEEFSLTLTSVTPASDPQISVGAPIGGTVTISDDDSAEIIIKATDPDASEPGDPASDVGSFEVLLVIPGSVDAANPFGIPAPASYDIQVNFSVSGTAIEGIDYDDLTPTQVTFSPGSTSEVINVTPEDDQLVEGDETVTLTLDANTVFSIALFNMGQTVQDITVTSGDCNHATVTIADDDTAQIAGIYVNGIDWTSLFRDRVNNLDDLGTSNPEDGSTFGYELTGRTDQQETVPWINVDQFIVEFDAPIDAASLDAGDFGLVGTPVSGFNSDFSFGDVPNIVSVVAGPGGNTAIVTLDGFLEPAELNLQILGTGIDTPGSGSNVVAGVDNNYSFLALPGDANQGSSSQFIINGADITEVVDRQNSLIFSGEGTFLDYSFFADLDGNGIVNGADLTASVDRQNSLVIPSTTSPVNGSSAKDDFSDQRDNRKENDGITRLAGASLLTESKFATAIDDVFATSDFEATDDDVFAKDLAIDLASNKSAGRK